MPPQDHPGAASRRADTTCTCARDLRVLVADDVAVIRSLMSRMLRSLGYDTDLVADGQEAVEALSERDYDVLLLDLSMPRMSGVDVVRWLNEDPARRDGLMVSVISASAVEERPILNELGVASVLAKPVRRHHLEDLLREVAAAKAPTGSCACGSGPST